jgi:predicted O-linked N-acetylglucosamine transferase (SPINDLY family)
MGAPFIDAIIADAIVIPPEEAAGYSEQVYRMPDCYQANDDRQAIDPQTPTRESLGLPREAFVFACFNKHYKIERTLFQAWMRILAAVPGSVLWMIDFHGARALQRHAEALGIDPRRLVFSGKLPKARHLARHACADLFLDTWTYNAHTTASDALWAGLPLLTLPGAGFASRVAASLLAAVGLPELIARDAQDYERMAVRLATHPQELRALRDRLAANRRTLPLFDTAKFTADIESLYLDLWQTHGELRRRDAGA